MMAQCGTAGFSCLSRNALRLSAGQNAKPVAERASACCLLRHRLAGHLQSSRSSFLASSVRVSRIGMAGSGRGLAGIACSAGGGAPGVGRKSSTGMGGSEFEKEVVVDGEDIKEVLIPKSRPSATGGPEYEKEVVVEGSDIKEVLIIKDGPQRATQRASEAAGDAAETAGEAAQDVAKTVGKAAGDVGDTLGESVEDVGESVGKAAEEVQEAAGDAGEAVARQAQEVGGTVVEAAQETGEAVAEQAQEVGEGLADATGEAAEAVGDAAEQVGQQVESTIEGVQEFAADTYEAVEEQADSLPRILEVEARKVAARGDRASRKIAEENDRYVGRVRSAVDSLSQGVQSGDLVGAITRAAGEGFEAADDLRKGVSGAISEAVEGAPVPADTTVDVPPPIVQFQPAKSGPYKGIRALVAGANGRTGRLIVESLVSKGVPVRALVRDVNKARGLRAMRGVTVVQGDIYRYETLHSALGDSNVVLCATGVKPDLFDPLGPYKYEYEGVVNLVALAKNKGCKKFVLVTSLGTSQLVNPFNLFYGLLWWKRQAELVLQRSGLAYTILRPGGLTTTSKRANVVFRQPDTTFGGAISRAQVAEACVAALVLPQADNKIVEVVAEENAPERSMLDLFSSI